MIIQNAIQMIQPAHAAEESASSNHESGDRAATPARIAAITALPAFERSHSLFRCSSVTPIRTARYCWAALAPRWSRLALEHIAESVELQRQLGIASGQRARQGSRRSEIQYKPAFQLAASF
jgi:hypothetical protein